jgi:hypothetical protein
MPRSFLKAGFFHFTQFVLRILAKIGKGMTIFVTLLITFFVTSPAKSRFVRSSV